MTDLLDSAPGFDQPIAVLKHCHGRMRKQLATLQKLLEHLPAHGPDVEAHNAARAVRNYYENAAPLHHGDEEQDLIPMLEATAQGADAELLAELVLGIHAEHELMDSDWLLLREQLLRIEHGNAGELSGPLVRDFCARYADHMEREESLLAPMAMRLLSPQQMAQLGLAMQVRRGIAATPESAPPLGQAVAGLRQEYSQARLMESDVADDPIVQFDKWFAEAVKAQVNEPSAMSLATAGADGKPGSRIVLVKQFDARGFTWYTNYASDKGRHLRENPHCALLFFWPELERQVRIEGRVEFTSEQDNEQYFNSRPRQSRLGAIASQQSAPIDSRAELEAAFDTVARQYDTASDGPPRPSHWGGYRVVPERIEFWQGRRSRMHDRIVFTREGDGRWTRARLQP